MSLQEALDVTKKLTDFGEPMPFSVEFVTCDQSRTERPSRHIKWAKAIRCGAAHNLVRHSQIGIKPLHGEHSQVAVHILLILKINGEDVV